jgi:hypothetical protein
VARREGVGVSDGRYVVRACHLVTGARQPNVGEPALATGAATASYHCVRA